MIREPVVVFFRGGESEVRIGTTLVHGPVSGGEAEAVAGWVRSRVQAGADLPTIRQMLAATFPGTVATGSLKDDRTPDSAAPVEREASTDADASEVQAVLAGTVADLRKRLSTHPQLAPQLLAAERVGKNRKSAIRILERAVADVP